MSGQIGFHWDTSDGGVSIVLLDAFLRRPVAPPCPVAPPTPPAIWLFRALSVVLANEMGEIKPALQLLA